MITTITNDDLIRHELIGLQVSIVKSSNPIHIGTSGMVVDETKNMLMIFDGLKKKWFPKKAIVYRFNLPDRSTVELDGGLILKRPVERIKHSSKRRYR